MNAIIQQIEAVRVSIDALQTERDELTHQTRSRREVVQYVDKRITALREQAARAAAQNLSNIAFDARATRPLMEVDAGGLRYVDVAPILSLFDAERLRAVLLADIDRIPVGLEAADKVRRLGEIEADLIELAREEEALIVEAEAAGADVQRRPDARPEIVLALQP